MENIFSVEDTHHKKNDVSLWAPTRNLLLQLYEILCRAQNDVGKVMRFRIGVWNDSTLYSPPLEGWLTKEDGVVLPMLFRALTCNLLLQPYEILCRAQNGRGYEDEILHQA
ncbi:MAG: hypothetical protein M9898_08505 [Chitinophagaceae bacterium]|nr:hypothetical protein [Chitinophagaceae bacterium]